MKIFAPLLWLSLLVAACQQDKRTDNNPPDDAKPALAVLAKPTYTVGDSVAIQLSQPLSQVTVQWDNKPAQRIVPVNNRLAFRSVVEAIGLHQLVVNGVTASNQKVADTLSVELWSDVKPQQLQYSVLQTYPHQASSFTQGLEFYNGNLYEGTGQNGESKLMKVDLVSGSALQSTSLSAQYFGEGITIVNDHIYQLTWTSGQCFRYTMDMTLEKTFAYHTQGWGLTHRDTTLILSDGTNRLYFYSPDFQPTGELVVYDDKGPVMNLNELEYVGGTVFANVWQTNRIVQIDLRSGKVIGELNIDPALVKGTDTQQNVLNGIAIQPMENALYITGKNWPALFKIQVKGLLTAKPKEKLAHR